MPTNSAAARYPRRGPTRRGDPSLAGLGTPLHPTDIYVLLRRLMRLSEAEIIQAFVNGAAALAEGAEGYLAEVADPEVEIAQATSVTRSRLMAWRKRGRQMTWDELRVLLLGLDAVEVVE